MTSISNYSQNYTKYFFVMAWYDCGANVFVWISHFSICTIRCLLNEAPVTFWSEAKKENKAIPFTSTCTLLSTTNPTGNIGGFQANWASFEQKKNEKFSDDGFHRLAHARDITSRQRSKAKVEERKNQVVKRIGLTAFEWWVWNFNKKRSFFIRRPN